VLGSHRQMSAITDYIHRFMPTNESLSVMTGTTQMQQQGTRALTLVEGCGV